MIFYVYHIKLTHLLPILLFHHKLGGCVEWMPWHWALECLSQLLCTHKWLSMSLTGKLPETHSQSLHAASLMASLSCFSTYNYRLQYSCTIGQYRATDGTFLYKYNGHTIWSIYYTKIVIWMEQKWLPLLTVTSCGVSGCNTLISCFTN